MSYYLALKHLHVACVALSGLGFCLRSLWMLAGSPLLQARWVKVAPHMVDTVLLGSALAMVFLSGQYPFVQGWLTAKVLGLVAYIGFGTMALKRARSKGSRIAFLILALATFAYIVSVALTKNPLPWY